MKQGLIAIGVIFLLVALAFLIWGQVLVARGERGTWEIWPYYIIHGAAGLLALVCFFVAWTQNRGSETKAAGTAPGEGES